MENNQFDYNIISTSTLPILLGDDNKNNNDKKEDKKTDFSIPTTFEDYLALSKNFYGGFWSRLVAYLIDLFVVIAVANLVNTYSFNLLNVSLDFPIVGESTLSFIIIAVLYFVLMTYYYSQTLGKIIMKLKVEPNTGGKLTFSQVFYREIVGRLLSILLFYLPYLGIIFTDKKKGLHDYIADTVVIKEDFSALRQKMNDKLKEVK